MGPLQGTDARLAWDSIVLKAALRHAAKSPSRPHESKGVCLKGTSACTTSKITSHSGTPHPISCGLGPNGGIALSKGNILPRRQPTIVQPTLGPCGALGSSPETAFHTGDLSEGQLRASWAGKPLQRSTVQPLHTSPQRVQQHFLGLGLIYLFLRTFFCFLRSKSSRTLDTDTIIHVQSVTQPTSLLRSDQPNHVSAFKRRLMPHQKYGPDILATLNHGSVSLLALFEFIESSPWLQWKPSLTIPFASQKKLSEKD